MPKLQSYTYERVKELCKKNKIPINEFNKWVYGQTCPILLSGKPGFFAWDVDRFILWKKKGIEPIWD